jgi:hypothetical protein
MTAVQDTLGSILNSDLNNSNGGEPIQQQSAREQLIKSLQSTAREDDDSYSRQFSKPFDGHRLLHGLLSSGPATLRPSMREKKHSFHQED